MSLFAKAQQQAAQVKVEEKDTLGGGFTITSGIHPAAIKMMYLDAWSSGALYVAIELAVLVDGQEKTHKENITISNKAGEFTYKDKKTNEDVPMPGYAMVDTMLRLATGKGFNDQDVQVKSIAVYDKDAKGNVNKDKEVIMSALRQKLKVGILLQTVDKTTLNQSTNKYEPNGETREENVIHKVFDFETDKTLLEIQSNKDAEFHKGWTERFAGKVINKAKGAAKGNAGVKSGAPAQAGADNPLFG